jgi:hypothetical protein
VNLTAQLMFKIPCKNKRNIDSFSEDNGHSVFSRDDQQDGDSVFVDVLA